MNAHNFICWIYISKQILSFPARATLKKQFNRPPTIRITVKLYCECMSTARLLTACIVSVCNWSDNWLITAWTVVQSCCISQQPNQCRRAIYNPWWFQNPWMDFVKT